MRVLRKLLLAASVGSAALLGTVSLAPAGPLAGLSQAGRPVQAIELPGVEGLVPEPVHYRRYYHRHYRRYYPHRYYRRHYYYRPYRYYAPRYYFPNYFYRPYYYRWW